MKRMAAFRNRPFPLSWKSTNYMPKLPAESLGNISEHMEYLIIIY